MALTQNGVLAQSELYFYHASERGKQLFFYPLCAGSYACDASYQVTRTHYDSYLLLFVQEGCLALQTEMEPSVESELPERSVSSAPPAQRRMAAGQTGAPEPSEVILRAGDCAVVDCYRWHHYHAEGSVAFFWVHLDGHLASSYVQMAGEEQRGLVSVLPVRYQKQMKRDFRMLLDMLAGRIAISEAQLSNLLTDLLTIWLERDQGGRLQMPQALPREEGNLEAVLFQLQTQYGREWSLQQLAALASLSPSQLIRRFRQETGQTPHQYLLRTRLHAAAYYLRTTQASGKEIAFACGFGSENSFCMAFKKAWGMTPGQYRSR